MKYVGMLVALAIVYYILARESPVEQVKEAVVQSEAMPLTQGAPAAVQPAVSSIKRPLDRTHDALEKVKTRNGDGEF